MTGQGEGEQGEVRTYQLGRAPEGTVDWLFVFHCPSERQGAGRRMPCWREVASQFEADIDKR